MSHSRQIFQADSPKRWKFFLWSARAIILLLLLSFGAIVVALLKNSYPSIPKLIGVSEEFKPLKNPDRPNEFRRAVKKKPRKAISENAVTRKSPLHSQVRAAFYVNWDAESFYSLKNNIGNLNLVLPEWLFVDPSADTVVTQIDWKAYRLIDSSSAKIVPLLSNFFHERWNHESVTRIVESPKKRKAFISNLIAVLKRYSFDGVSIDFEDLYSLRDDQNLVDFHQQLYDSLHANQLLASQCVPPFNRDYRVSELHKFNDYIFVMAYDQHFATSKAGPVSSAKWVEQVLDVFTEKIQPEKFVLCLAGYGYDWLKGGTGRDVTFQEAISTAKETHATIGFDNGDYNVHYNYFDDSNLEHEVWYADAATNYNIMRTAAEYGLAGVALWRLGSEDPRLWTFYKNNLSVDSLSRNPTDKMAFTHIKGTSDVDYIGDVDAQILDVLASPHDGEIRVDYDQKEMLITEETYVQLPSSYVIKKTGNAHDKEIVLTFDDGPDPLYTPQILEILKREKVPAAFFMIGENMQENIPLVKRIYEEGYEIGNHTFTHPNLAETSAMRAKLELNVTRRLLEIITGHSTILFRPPFNSDVLSHNVADIVPIVQSRGENYLTVGESIDPQDWKAGVTADSIYDRIVNAENKSGILLMHDAGGNRSATVEALPKIIQYYKEQGYRFASIAQLMGKNKNDLMPSITGKQQKFINHANFLIADSFFLLLRFIAGFFFIAIFLAIARMAFIAILAYIQSRKSKLEPLNAVQPMVSIIIPAYNESVNALKSVRSLLNSSYPEFEIIFVNDGSKDDTLEIVNAAFENEKQVRIFTKLNGGKASALNYGIERATGDYVVCIDADTQLRPDAISRLMESFNDENVGAVAGNVKVGNLVNMLTEWQSIEYITAQNFDRRAFDLLNCITVVPGAIGAFRKSALIRAGGFTSDTLAEDCDLTVRILSNGYRVKNNTRAIAVTEAPEHISQFLKQRFRWTFGVFQTFWKNRHTLFNPQYKALGMVAMPNILFFQILLPLFAPLVDLVMIAGLFTGNAAQIGIYYLLFQCVEIAGSALAFSFEREKIWRLWMLVPQRFTYRWLMYYILFKSLYRAAKGELQSWGVLKRTGNVKIA